MAADKSVQIYSLWASKKLQLFGIPKDNLFVTFQDQQQKWRAINMLVCVCVHVCMCMYANRYFGNFKPRYWSNACLVGVLDFVLPLTWK